MLPAGFVQIDLFASAAEPEPAPKQKPKPKRRARRKGTVYRCKCGKSVEVFYPTTGIKCSCGKQMKEEDEE